MEGKWVFGGVPRGCNLSFMEVVENRDKNTLLKIIKKRIKPRTTIISDCWRSYDCLKDEGYLHISVNHSINFKNPETGAHIEGTWSAIKRGLRDTNHQKGYFDAYLAEYLWRSQHRDSNDIVGDFLIDVVKIYPPSVQDDTI